MRKIVSNYVYLPGYALIKYGCVEIEDDHIVKVIDFGGKIQECPGVEFYGGMLVAGGVKLEMTECSILEYLDELYSQKSFGYKGLSIIENADLIHLRFLPQTTIRKI